MRRWFAPLDDRLIDHLFQPLSDWLSIGTRLRRPLGACVCLDLGSLCWILARAGTLSDAVRNGDVGMAVFYSATLLLGLSAFLALRTVFRRFGGRAGANPLRLSMRPHRAVILLLLVSRPLQYGLADIGDLADLGMLMFAVLGLYLGACMAPPSVGRAVFEAVRAGFG